MDHGPYAVCLQCGEAGPSWDRQIIRRDTCDFDDAHGFAAVPEIFNQFARFGLSIKPSGQ